MADIVKSVSEIFSNKVFRIPDYQRGFSWEEKQLKDLIEDLELLPEDRNHFTGTMVLRTSSNGSQKVKDIKGNSYSKFDIIDGQQRMTTFVILLKAIYNEMQDMPIFKDLAEGLREKYLHNLDLNRQPFTKLTLNQDCQAFFSDNILELHPSIVGPTIRSHQLLIQADRYYADYLDKKKEEYGETFPKWLRELYFKIVDHLTLIVYPVEDELDAGIIFETMNDRGKPLTELELVKNYLLYLTSKLELENTHDLNQRINNTWKHIYESLMAAGLGGRQYEDQLLRAHWLMAYDYDTRRWQNNRSIKERFSLKRYKDKHQELLQYLIEYLDSLKNAATAYCDIRAPERLDAFNEIQEAEIRRNIILWSKKLARLGSRAGFLPLLMAVRLKSDDEGETYLQIAELCEKFDFRVYQWLRYRSNAGESRLYRLANQYHDLSISERLQEELSRALLEYCPDSRFIERFDREDENWYRWGGISYFLYEYEHNLAEGRPIQMSWQTLNVRPKADSIEHILPQTPDHPYWQERFTLELSERWTQDIGNLCLTFDNSRMGNKSFPEKRGAAGEIGCYAGSPLFIERKLSSYDNWNVESIVDRRDKIKKWAVKRWHVDAPPPLPIQKESSIEQMIALAELNDLGEELEAIHNAATKLKLNARVRKSIQYRPPFDWTLSVMNVQVYQGGFWIYFRLHNFAKYRSVSREQVDELFQYKNNSGSWITADDVPELVESLEGLYELVKDELA